MAEVKDNMSAIKKEVTIGDCRLILGDCLQVMKSWQDERQHFPPTVKVHAVITDPPYGIEDIVGSYGRGGRTIHNDKCLTALEGAYKAVFGNIWMLLFYSCRITPQVMDIIRDDYVGESMYNKR